MIPEKECRKSWNCPSDRELKLRAKLNAGWSVHSANFLHKIEPIPPSELQSIENVIRRAQELEQMEVERVGRMLCRIENMTRNAMGDGKNTCSMCGMAFGLFRSSFVYCSDCAKAVCEKCRVDTYTLSLEICMLCKICAENREIWKKSGGWFYGRFPTLTEDCHQERISQISASPGPVRGYNTWSHRAPDIVRLESFEPPEENHNENSSYKDWSMSSTPNLVRLKVSEQPDENHNENSFYKDLLMSSTPDLNSLKEEDEASYTELESPRENCSDKDKLDSHFLFVQSPNLSSSCPALTELQEPSKLKRKPSIRRKRTSTPIRNKNK